MQTKERYPRRTNQHVSPRRGPQQAGRKGRAIGVEDLSFCGLQSEKIGSVGFQPFKPLIMHIDHSDLIFGR